MLKRLLKYKPAVPAGQRVYAIGDVHGRLDLFNQLLAQLEQDNFSRPPADVTLVLLGDLIDRGPDSRGVVSRARRGVPWGRTIALKGNHEAIMLDALDGKRSEFESWLKFGGKQTLESWGISSAIINESPLDDIIAALRLAISPGERHWFSRMRLHIRFGDYFFVHAGVKPGVALDRQIESDCLWIREEFLASKRQHGAVVVHGHSISKDVELLHNRIGVDTGAYATGRLTAIGLSNACRWIIAT